MPDTKPGKKSPTLFVPGSGKGAKKGKGKAGERPRSGNYDASIP